MRGKSLRTAALVMLAFSLLWAFSLKGDVQAATKDAFGLEIGGTLSDTTLKNNPYGTDSWFSLFRAV